MIEQEFVKKHSNKYIYDFFSTFQIAKLSINEIDSEDSELLKRAKSLINQYHIFNIYLDKLGFENNFPYQLVGLI